MAEKKSAKAKQEENSSGSDISADSQSNGDTTNTDKQSNEDSATTKTKKKKKMGKTDQTIVEKNHICYVL